MEGILGTCQVSPQAILLTPAPPQGWGMTKNDNRMTKLMGLDKHKEIAYQLLLQAKQTQLGEN